MVKITVWECLLCNQLFSEKIQAEAHILGGEEGEHAKSRMGKGMMQAIDMWQCDTCATSLVRYKRYVNFVKHCQSKHPDVPIPSD
jgi:uncharacterized short protein YbdD (DUF466 family)